MRVLTIIAIMAVALLSSCATSREYYCNESSMRLNRWAQPGKFSRDARVVTVTKDSVVIVGDYPGYQKPRLVYYAKDYTKKGNLLAVTTDQRSGRVWTLKLTRRK